MIYDVVQRPFQADGLNRMTGEILLDAKSFRNRDRLRNHRYLADYSGEVAKCRLCGRVFAADKEIFKAHFEKNHPGYRFTKNLMVPLDDPAGPAEGGANGAETAGT